MTSSNKNRQVIHVHLLISNEHLYFGSIKAMYQHFTRDELGVAEQTLYNSWKDQTYTTDLVVLRKGRLIQKEQQKFKKAELLCM
jgi:hypothetical protein